MTWVKDDKGLDWPCVWSSWPAHFLQRKLSSSFPACCGEHASLDRVLWFSNVAVTLSVPGSVPGQHFNLFSVFLSFPGGAFPGQSP